MGARERKGERARERERERDKDEDEDEDEDRDSERLHRNNHCALLQHDCAQRHAILSRENCYGTLAHRHNTGRERNVKHCDARHGMPGLNPCLPGNAQTLSAHPANPDAHAHVRIAHLHAYLNVTDATYFSIQTALLHLRRTQPGSGVLPGCRYSSE